MTHLPLAFAAEEMRRRGYEVTGSAHGYVTGGAADSRLVRPGDLFVAFPGEHHDGNDFIAEALGAGAAGAICTRLPEGEWPDRLVVVAPDATRAAAELAHAWRMRCAPKVVGITGTVGKTTAKELTAAVLARLFRTHRSQGNFNSREGLPLALYSLDSEDRVSVLEMGMDSRGEIRCLCETARPDVGVVLNIGLTHVEKLGSPEAIAEEKLALPRWLPPSGTAVLNADDPRIAAAISGLRCGVISFGTASDSTIQVEQVEDGGLAGCTATIRVHGSEYTLRSPLPGRHTLPAALTALGCALALGIDVTSAIEAIADASIDGRARIIATRSGATIVDDRYNASPASVLGDLQMLGATPGRRIALLGKMAELGDFAEEEHRRVGETAARTCDLLVSFGDFGRVVVEAATVAGMRAAHWFETKEEAARFVAAQLGPGVALLVKGSRSEALETVLPMLEGRP